MQNGNHFVVLENSAIGHNIAMYRRIRGMKALEMAQRLGLKEAAYTRYERGEVAITIGMVQQVADLLKMDPIHLLVTPAGSMIDQKNNFSNATAIDKTNNSPTINEQQLQLTLKLIENVTNLCERQMELIRKNGNENENKNLKVV
jgi:transcriptional regulator with XRE-family HTH domain